MDDREQQIAERAHQIWESNGRPEGRHEEHWQQACREIDGDLNPAGSESAGLAGVAQDESLGTQDVGPAPVGNPSTKPTAL